MSMVDLLVENLMSKARSVARKWVWPPMDGKAWRRIWIESEFV